MHQAQCSNVVYWGKETLRVAHVIHLPRQWLQCRRLGILISGVVANAFDLLSKPQYFPLKRDQTDKMKEIGTLLLARFLTTAYPKVVTQCFA